MLVLALKVPSSAACILQLGTPSHAWTSRPRPTHAVSPSPTIAGAVLLLAGQLIEMLRPSQIVWQSPTRGRTGDLQAQCLYDIGGQRKPTGAQRVTNIGRAVGDAWRADAVWIDGVVAGRKEIAVSDQRPHARRCVSGSWLGQTQSRSRWPRASPACWKAELFPSRLFFRLDRRLGRDRCRRQGSRRCRAPALGQRGSLDGALLGRLGCKFAARKDFQETVSETLRVSDCS